MKPNIFFLLILLSLFGYSLLNSKTQQTAKPQPKKLTPCSAVYSKTDCDLWASKIDTLGGAQAYKEFKNQYASFDTGTQHQMAHLFGNLLYQKLGTTGISVCDTVFNYGCYHGFFGAAVGSEGLGVITRLSKNCDEGCQHGIGHGIVVYLGYDIKNLNDALDVCKKSNLLGGKLGCKGGAFMEFNMKTMLGIDKINKFEPKTPYSPCLDVPHDSQPACFYWLSQWWNNSLHTSNEVTIRTEGTMCTSLSDTANKNECFLGIGGALQQFAGWKAKDNVDSCAIITDENGNLLCRAGAARMFFADFTKRAGSQTFCDDLLGGTKTECQKLVGEQTIESTHNK